MVESRPFSYDKKKYITNDDDEIAYFTVRWKTRASFIYRHAKFHAVGKAPAEKSVSVHKKEINGKLSIPPYTTYGGI